MALRSHSAAAAPVWRLPSGRVLVVDWPAGLTTVAVMVTKTPLSDVEVKVEVKLERVGDGDPAKMESLAQWSPTVAEL